MFDPRAINWGRGKEAADIITELRDAWAQAMKKAREEKGAQNAEGSGGYAG